MDTIHTAIYLYLSIYHKKLFTKYTETTNNSGKKEN